jgi:PleD family two-component response regulator
VFGTEVTVTASVGAAVGDERTDAVSLLRAADAAMYRAKRAGGNRVVVLAD